MVKIKVCGITRPEDAFCAAEAGVDALGFVFYTQSPRFIRPEQAHKIIAKLPPFITPVGVFVNEEVDVIERIIKETGIQAVQLHGDESPALCTQVPSKVIKAFRIQGHSIPEALISQYKVDAILLDAYCPHRPGGTGMTFHWQSAAEIKRYGPVILAGGLTPENVAAAISCVAPYAVDVSSGVETAPGKKDPRRIREFVEKVRQSTE